MDKLAVKSNEDKLKILLEWKKLYIEALIDSLKPTGNVLEIGFGTGIAAESIQKFHPKSHTIVESNSQVLNEAKNWANKNPNTTVISGKWENLLPSLGTFDAIFFNDYPVEEDMAIMNFLFPEEALQTSNEAKNLLNLLEKQMSQLTMKFTDQEIEDFYQKIGQFNSKELPKFFQKLKENGNISNAQFENLIKKYHIAEQQKEPKDNLQKKTEKPDNMLLFLNECLKKHMKKGSRFSAFLNGQASKYEDSRFFDQIITNPDLEYQETSVSVNMSDRTRQALIMWVEKHS